MPELKFWAFKARLLPQAGVSLKVLFFWERTLKDEKKQSNQNKTAL